MPKANAELGEIIKINSGELIEGTGVIEPLKAVKNEVQAAGMKAANVRDCAAIMKYFAFLEEELAKPDHGLDEYIGAEKLLAYRAQGELFQGASFDTISSIGPNGAVIHYKPEKDTALKLNNNEIYLLDSGGQYLDGTTDITRCGHFGGQAPTAFQKEAYTRVLLGTLEVERLVWPADSAQAGMHMDVLARRNLWAVGLDFKHGTGHGVGHYLNVHEGPCGISRVNKTILKPGMCVSDEPGFYKDGEFGIRIENVIICQKHETLEGFLCWENMTTAPYCRDLIDLNLLSPDMRAYIDKFHAKVLDKLTPLLQDDARALKYVQRMCAPL